MTTKRENILATDQNGLQTPLVSAPGSIAVVLIR